MNKRCVYKLGAIVGTLLFMVLPWGSSAEDIVADVSAVQGMEWYRGPEAGKELLAKNGFVVTPRFYHRIFGPYLDKNLPHFVTADSVHRTFHVLFEEHLKELEKGLAGEITALIWATLAGVEGMSDEAVATGSLASKAVEARELAIHYLQVAEALIATGDANPALSPAVSAELALIQAAGGVEASPLFGRPMDYSQFKPRGFYTESPALQRHFRTIAWFGNGAFPLTSTRDTLAAFMLARAMADSPTARSRWRELDQIYTGFLAPCDDLTPVEYGGMLDRVGPLDSPAALEAAIATLRSELRDPRINSMALSPDQMDDWVYYAKGMRFLGKRYLPDSEIFMNLTEPKVAGRAFPTGLDVMAANGSARAVALMAETDDGKRSDYRAGVEKAVALLDGIKASDTSQYAKFLRVAETLTDPPVEQAAAFAKTEAYADKNLMTALGAWASMRHAWVLHAKQSHLTRGYKSTDVPPGYVEPNPEFFHKVLELSAETRALFVSAGLTDVGRLTEFEGFLGELAEIVRKELAEESLSGEERHLLLEYGFTIAHLQGFEINTGGDTGFPWMSLVADVHTEGSSGQCLEVATGGAMPIYTVMEHEGKPFLFVGGVYSYYEFLQPIGERMTDEAWREKWQQGDVPPLPSWTASFVGNEYDVENLIARLRNDEVVEGLEFIHDPALDDFLIENVRSDSEMWSNRNCAYLFNAASRRAPEIVNPMLLGMLRDGELRMDKLAVAAPDYRNILAAVAAAGLRGNIREEDVPALKEILLLPDYDRCESALDTLVTAKGKFIEALLLSVLWDTEDTKTKDRVLRSSSGTLSIDATPALLALFQAEKGVIKSEILESLGFIWTSHYDGRKSDVPAYATERQLEAWGSDVVAVFLDTLRAYDWATHAEKQKALQTQTAAIWDKIWKIKESGQRPETELDIRYSLALREEHALKYLTGLIGRLHIDAAVPFLVPGLRSPNDEIVESVFVALATIGTEEAIESLVRALRTVEVSFGIEQAILSLSGDAIWGQSETSAHTFYRLLADTTNLDNESVRVCDVIVRILGKNEYQDEPGLPASDSLADRDAKAQEWIDYHRRESVR